MNKDKLYFLARRESKGKAVMRILKNKLKMEIKLDEMKDKIKHNENMKDEVFKHKVSM
jgi:hypothetical protein